MIKQSGLRLLALGDSYTIGEQVLPEERFPVQTASLLKTRGIHLDEVRIIATTGWTTGELMKAIESEKPEGTFDIVTLLIGVNNQYRGSDTGLYRMEFTELLRIAVNFAGGRTERVYVLSIPDWGVTPFAAGKDTKKIAGEIDDYNNINRSASLNAGVHYLDITDITRLSPGDATLLAPDGLHPSGKMYAMWAERLATLIETTL